MGGLPLPPVPYVKTLDNIVADFAASAQSSSATPLDFSEGSIFLALAEATAGNSDWLQKLFLFSLLVQRLYTSSGKWVDTWAADFMPQVNDASGNPTSSPRLPANFAIGVVTFSSITFDSQRIVPVGTLVSTADSTQVYQVNTDTSNSAYNASIIPGGGYVLAAGTPSVNVNVTALIAGSAANVQANSITSIRSSVVGIDSVTNPSPINTGLNEESDTALKARFPLFIQSLRAGTKGAIQYVIASIGQGLQSTIHENVDPSGNTSYGAVTVYVYGGSNLGSLITTAQTLDSSNILQFAAPLPSWMATGLTLVDTTTPAAIVSAQTVLGFNPNASGTLTVNGVVLQAGQVLLAGGTGSSGDVDQTVALGDSISFSSLVSEAASAVDSIRAAGVRPSVVPASTVFATVSMTVTIASGYYGPTVVAAVQNAIGAYINALNLEAMLPYTILSSIAYGASAGVSNVSNVTINYLTSDLVPASGQIIRSGTITVNQH